MRIVTVGIDLAKNVFAVHGVDDKGKSALVKPKATRLGIVVRSSRPAKLLWDMFLISFSLEFLLIFWIAQILLLSLGVLFELGDRFLQIL